MLKSSIMLAFIKESVDEIKKVNWPNRATLTRLTAYVIGVSLIVGIYVLILDSVLNLSLEKFILN